MIINSSDNSERKYKNAETRRRLEGLIIKNRCTKYY